MMLTAIAIDDEPQALDVVKLLAQKVPYLDLKATFTNAMEALVYLQNNRVDLLYIDINMPDISGIDVVKSLPRAPMVVFTTAYSEYAVQGFELDAIDYLLKPFSLPRFVKACNKALEKKLSQQTDAVDSIFVKTGYEEEKVLLRDILYIEADGNYITWVLTNKKLLSRQTLNDIQTILPSSQFVRVHRSFIIALDKVARIARHELTVGDIQVPVGASYEHVMKTIREKLI
ncbi:LytTR family DNA-binding domain-containing protein [Telluribacter sp. SYSU D00476]|uniref:LytR/AlgR family response regulator transcription factor n=1 Tax=Telluribacter sp. SYSU D00476 TaxID=2811430 RepID=UPI001FF3CEB8|nr:LytTR family DNA-binding domain-containing protein [Telluribacter sp. SYSU D00476]